MKNNARQWMAPKRVMWKSGNTKIGQPQLTQNCSAQKLWMLQLG